jgi:hypothetical protein
VVRGLAGPFGFVVVGIALVFAIVGWRSSEDVELATLGFAALTAIAAVGAIREARLAREEERHARTLARLERVGELLGELGERAASAGTGDPRLHFLQQRLRVAVAALGTMEGLDACRRTIELDAHAAGAAEEIHATAEAALAEVATLMDAAATAPTRT